MREKNRDKPQNQNRLNIISKIFSNFFCIVFIFLNYTFCKPPDVLAQFVENHLIIVESKMKNSPKLWLDIKEGYSRQKIIFFSNLIMDSLDIGLSGYHAAIRYIPKIDSLRKVALSSREFEYLIKKKTKLNSRENYFSTSIE